MRDPLYPWLLFPCAACALQANPGTDESSDSETSVASETSENAETDSSDTQVSESSETDTDTGTEESADSSTDSDTDVEQICGDGVVTAPEACDDGNAEPADGCEPDCSRTTIEHVTLSDYTTCIIFGSGHARCWGDNGRGELGLGHTDNIGDDELPWTAPLLAIDEPFAQIEQGHSSACGVLENGEVYCWGRNHRGQLGYGSTEDVGDDELPWLLGAVNFAGSAAAVDMGAGYACVLMTSDEVKCWGRNEIGELGYGHTTQLGDDELPHEYGVLQFGEPIAQIALSLSHACALTHAGGVVCWGGNYSGELGYGIGNDPIGDDELPMGNVLPPGVEAKQITVGTSHSCALLESDEVLCWGQGYQGQHGTGFPQDLGDDEQPTLDDVAVLSEGLIVQMVGGFSHICVLYENGAVHCWGGGPFGQLGYGDPQNLNIGDDEYPTAFGPVDLGGPVDRIWASENATCARRENGDLYCWGHNINSRALGYDTMEDIGDDETPEQMGPVPVFGE